MKKYRNEWKFCCQDAQLGAIECRLNAILEKDLHAEEDGKYRIHSLYFDDYRDSCMMDNDAGLSERYKYRIRYYGEDINSLKLERKEKKNGRCYKASCNLTLLQYEKLINNRIDELLWETENKELQRFCVEMMTKVFQPKVIIDYERVAYVEPITNVRVTLDENISASNSIEYFLNGDYLKTPIQKTHQQVLEVKFDYILPGYIKKIVEDNCLLQTSFSKYYLGRQALVGIGRK